MFKKKGLGLIRFVVIDDEQDMLNLYLAFFKQEIRSSQVSMETFLSPKEALAYLVNSRFKSTEIILSDINMPDMSGLELLAEVRANSPTIPFFLVTAYDDISHRSKAEHLNASGYITKPVNFKNLKALIANLKLSNANRK